MPTMNVVTAASFNDVPGTTISSVAIILSNLAARRHPRLLLTPTEVHSTPQKVRHRNEKGQPRRPLNLTRGRRSSKMTTDAVSVVVVVLFVLFAGMVAYIIRPRNRRKSRRRVALSAAADSQNPPFIERRRASVWSRLKDFLSRGRQ
jgi:hypothetical protein